MSSSVRTPSRRAAVIVAIAVATMAGAAAVPGAPLVGTAGAANAACSPTTTTDGGWTYVAVTATGSCDWTPPAGVTKFDYLVVGGGASGSVPHGGGGGAGGMRSGSFTVASGAVTVSVGAGGAGRLRPSDGTGLPGLAGQGTSVSFVSSCAAPATITALGGGPANWGGGSNGFSGGSGGGILDPGPTYKPGAGAPLQGNAGGNGLFGPYASGGGGGAGAVAANASGSGGGNGGAGRAWLPGTFNATIATGLGLDSSLVSGGNVYFAGGGGGGATAGGAAVTPLPGGQGGVGGGGPGGSGSGSATTSNATGTDAIAGSGGGGGGGGIVDNGGPNSGYSLSGSGGSGIVILRYKTTPTDDTRTPLCVVPNDRSITPGTTPAPDPSTYTFAYTDTSANPVTPTITGTPPECASAYAPTDATGVTRPIYCAGGSDTAYLFDTSPVSTLTVGSLTSTSDSLSSTSVTAGDAITATATVTATSATQDPTGTVTWYACYDATTTPATCDSSTWSSVGSTGLSGGTSGDGTATAATAWTPSTAGKYALRASYGGDATYAGSLSPSDAVTVAAAASLTSQITDGTATCSTASAGTSPSLSTIQYSLKGTKISQVNAGVFVYWAKWTVTSPGSVNQVALTQSRPTSGWPYLAQAAGTQLFDASCRTVKGVTVTTSGSGATSIKTGNLAAGTYYIAVKYSATSVLGTSNPSSPGVYSFTSSLGASPPPVASLSFVYKK